MSCGGGRYQLASSPEEEPELQELEGERPAPRIRLLGAEGQLRARHAAPGTRLSVTLGDQEGTLALSCHEQRLQLRWEGPPAGTLRIAAAPSLRFVPGGPPQGGEQDAPFAVIAWGERGLRLGAGRFLWRDEPQRFEAALQGPLELLPGPPGALIAGAFAERGRRASRTAGRMESPYSGAGLTILGLDREGKMAGAGVVGAAGVIDLGGDAAMTAVHASAGGTRVGPVVEAKDGFVLPGPEVGVLRVRVVEHDRGVALPSRVVVHGHRRDRSSAPGTREPNLGPPHRASGAGPLLDTEDGRARLTLPGGIYRVLATRGLEYTIDEQEAEVIAGAEREVELRLRRVVATPGWAGSDLHVHARGSFDALVSIDDRVRSLMAAGLDLAAASEHNRTGSYDLSTLVGQGAWLTWIPAVEVTTVDPLRGHFNVLPYERAEVPRYQRTSLQELLSFVARESPGSLIQVNHPRMGKIGHFNALHLDAQTQRGLGQLARGFDLLEIYNGFDLADTARTEGLLREWLALLERGRTHWATGNSDSHSVQYTGVGYPRTYVAVPQDHDGGEGAPLDVPGLLNGLRRGKIVATSGPFVEVSQGNRGPGEALELSGGKARIRVKIQAAPWIDASEMEVFIGGKSALKRSLPGGPGRRTGRPEGSLPEGRRLALRLDEELELAVEPGARSLVVVVRGQRKVGEVLPFMDWAPMAIVNPMWLEAR